MQNGPKRRPKEAENRSGKLKVHKLATVEQRTGKKERARRQGERPRGDQWETKGRPKGDH